MPPLPGLPLLPGCADGVLVGELGAPGASVGVGRLPLPPLPIGTSAFARPVSPFGVPLLLFAVTFAVAVVMP